MLSTPFPTFSLRRHGAHVATVMLFPSVMGFSAGIASNGGFKQAEGYGDTAVAALHDLTRKILGREFSHEIKTQVIPKLAAN